MKMKRVRDLRVLEIVAADVVAESGAFLCRKGSKVTAELIRRFERHAVAAVPIEAAPTATEEVATLDDAQRATIRAAVDLRFTGVPATPLSLGVREAVVRALSALPPASAPAPLTPEPGARRASPFVFRPDVPALVEQVSEVPTLSTVYERFAAEIASAGASAATAARVIEEDPGLTVRVLRMASSSLLARGAPVTTVSQAIVRLGFRAVQSIVLSSSTLRALERYSGPAFEQLWRHGFAVATAARSIKAQLRFGEPEESFTAGLLHDMGQMVMRGYEPEAYGAVLDQVAHDGVSIPTAERSAFGLDHAALGELLARRWKLPDLFVHVIRHHHAPEAAGGDFADVAIVAVADAIARALGLGSDGDPRVDWPSERCWEALQLTPDDVESLCVAALSDYREFDEFYGFVRPATARRAPEAPVIRTFGSSRPDWPKRR